MMEEGLQSPHKGVTPGKSSHIQLQLKTFERNVYSCPINYASLKTRCLLIELDTEPPLYRKPSCVDYLDPLPSRVLNYSYERGTLRRLPTHWLRKYTASI